MAQKLVFIKLILIVFVTFTFQTIVGQEYKKKTILLTVLLDRISNEHKIFFTYSANLLSNRYIQEEGFVNLSLKESVYLLEKITPFLFDDLGNNYYVIYNKKSDYRNKYLSKEKVVLVNSSGVDSIFKGDTVLVRGTWDIICL